MQLARVTVFAGHFGSGKTSLAIAYAISAKRQKDHVVLCDLDIVNPYFRTADAAKDMARAGIKLVTSQFANTNVDAPALPAEARSLFDNKSITGIIDLGGDDRGALAIGRYAGLLERSSGYEMLLVINQYRPLTRNFNDLCEIKDEIEKAGKVNFTALVNNSNLGTETTLEDVVASASFAYEASEKLELPLKMTAINRCLVLDKESEEKARAALGELFILDLPEKQDWNRRQPLKEGSWR